MAGWQEKSAGRIGNTDKLFDAPAGHFSRSPKGRGPFGRWLCRSSLMDVASTSLLTPVQRTKMPSVAAMTGVGIDPRSPHAFVRDNTALIAPPLVPEIMLHLATEIVPLWRKTEEELAEHGVPPPYWAFAWAGGQALARYVLDHPEIVKGKSVLDFGAGSGLVALAAAKAGAADVLAADIDAFALAAMAANAEANALTIAITSEDMIGSPKPFDVILVGDMCYERPLAERLMAWLKRSRAAIFFGDPGRSYFSNTGMENLATYRVQTTRELEDREIRETGVYRLLAP